MRAFLRRRGAATALAFLLLYLFAGCGRRSPGGSETALPPRQAIQFTEIGPRAGIAFVHNNGAFGERFMPETVGSGAAFFDYDGDGYPDLFLVNGRDWTPQEVEAYARGNGKPRASHLPKDRQVRRTTCALYHNNRNGTFTDVTSRAHLDICLYGMGVCAGDYDNDGRTDLFVTGLDRNYLLHNNGDGTFTDTTKKMGLESTSWCTSAAWLDYDNDGKLDLIVGRYIRWTPAGDIFASANGVQKSYVGPVSYTGLTSRLYRNTGAGFEDVSERAGIAKQKGKSLIGKTLGVAVLDYNRDGKPDILLTNDTEPNFLFKNNGNGTFTEVGSETGIAYNEAGKSRAGMGVDAADIDGSGTDTVVIGNFSDEMLGMYRYSNGLFTDTAPHNPIGNASLKFLTFGCMFLDVDNDGRLDMAAANGHVDSDVHESRPDLAFRQRPLLFRNKLGDKTGGEAWEEIGLQSGSALQRPLIGRGLACADIDLDGRIDMIITSNNEKPLFLHNETHNANNAIRITLEGVASNRSAIGARLEAVTAGQALSRVVMSGSSFLSQSELPVTLGIGPASVLDALTVRWPSGRRTDLKNLPANRSITINEAKGLTKSEPLPGRNSAAH